MIKIEATGLYGESIRAFLGHTLPQVIVTNKDKLEALSSLLMASGNLRYGPKPDPESQVLIRQTIREALENNQPVPVLVPWGSRKPHLDYSVDIGEVMALKTLMCLQRSAREIYKKGLDLRLRVEDLGGKWLFADEGERFIRSSDRYVKDFTNLIHILDVSRTIKTTLESEHATQEEHDCTARGLVMPLYEYISETDRVGLNHYESLHSYQLLIELGWQGSIPTVQREYYRGLYRKHYPDANINDLNMMLSRYLAGALARYLIKAVGVDPSWRTYIQLNFASPVPGAPEAMIGRRIHYRTIPANYTRTHPPAWRGRGVFKTTNDGVQPSMFSWYEKLDLIPREIKLERGTTQTTIHTDLLIQEDN